MRDKISEFLNKEVKVKAPVFNEEGKVHIESGTLSVGDIPAFYASALAGGARVYKEKLVKRFAKKADPIEFNPNIHLTAQLGDVVYYNDLRWVVWSKSTEGDHSYRIARATIDTTFGLVDVVYVDTPLLYKEAAMADTLCMNTREYDYLMGDAFTVLRTPHGDRKNG